MSGPELVKDTPRNLLVFAAGVPNSGKSTGLHNLFIQRTSRVIELDFMGEVPQRNPNVIKTYGFAELKECLADMASENVRRWHLAAVLELDDVARMFAVLAPEIRSADSTSYTREVGGLAVACGECSIIAPNAGAAEPVRAAFMRGRHHWLSLYMATQRPAEVNRCVTGVAQVLMAFATHEEADLAYWRKKISPAVSDMLPELPPHHSVYYVPGDRIVRLLDENYNVIKEMNRSGEPLAASA